MNDIEKKFQQLAIAATGQGMRLEFDASQHLTDYFKSRKIEGVNQIKRQFYDNDNCITQIDVYGRYPSTISQPNHIFHFIIACKGKDQDTELLMVEHTRAFYQEYSNAMKLNCIELSHAPSPVLSAVTDDVVAVQSGSNIANIPQGDLSATTAAFAGCFYQRHGEQFVKVRDQENRTDLLHANLKLQATANALIHNNVLLEPDVSNLLIPMVFTNAQICMINYEENIIYRVPWTLQMIRLDNMFKNLGYLPYVVICSSNHFAECVGSVPSFAYPLNWDFAPVAIPKN